MTMTPEDHSTVPDVGDEILVLPVTEQDDVPDGPTPTASELTAALTEIQTELAGTAKTGVPSVDAALERLADLDPNDLAGSAEILQDVLRRLEGTIQES